MIASEVDVDVNVKPQAEHAPDGANPQPTTPAEEAKDCSTGYCPPPAMVSVDASGSQ